MHRRGHEWVKLVVNAMTTPSMESTSQELLRRARKQRGESNGPSLQQETSVEASRSPDKTKRPSHKVKQRLTVTLPAELLDRLRNAVYWTSGLTVAGLIEQSLTEALDRMEKQHGEPFPPRTEELKGGRPRRIRSGSYQG